MVGQFVCGVVDLTFRYRCTEQPYKIPLYAALVAFLSAGSGEEVDDDAETGAQVAVRAVLEDFVKGFQGYVDELKWLQMKLCVSSVSEFTCSVTSNRPPIDTDPIFCSLGHLTCHHAKVFTRPPSITNSRVG